MLASVLLAMAPILGVTPASQPASQPTSRATSQPTSRLTPPAALSRLEKQELRRIRALNTEWVKCQSVAREKLITAAGNQQTGVGSGTGQKNAVAQIARNQAANAAAARAAAEAHPEWRRGNLWSDARPGGPEKFRILPGRTYSVRLITDARITLKFVDENGKEHRPPVDESRLADVQREIDDGRYVARDAAGWTRSGLAPGEYTVEVTGDGGWLLAVDVRRD